MAVILLDGDGTCWAKVPHGYYSKDDIGSERVLKELVAAGHQLVLWTCRNNSRKNPYNYHLDGGWRRETSLGEAVRWFNDRGIPLSGINSYPPGELLVGKTLKPLGDVIIDDTALGVPIKESEVSLYSVRTNRPKGKKFKTQYVDWDAVEALLKERGLL